MENVGSAEHELLIVPSIGIEINGADAAEGLRSMIVPECLGSCSILGLVAKENRQQLLEKCAADTQLWCHGPRDGQAPGRTVCGQPEEAKRQLWNTIHPNRNRTT